MKVLIIGAGTSGLAAAVRIAAAGHQVEVFERGTRPGGRMGLIQGQGFRFDLAPTIVMMPEIYRDVFRAAGRDPDDYIPMQRVEPIYGLHFPSGERYRVKTDLVEFTRFLEGFGQAEANGYLRYLSETYSRYLVAKDHFIDRSFRGPADFYNPTSLVNALRLKTFDSAWDSVSRRVKDDRLRKLLSFQTLYIGIAPRNGPSIYSIIPMIETLYGVWFIKGGMYAMAEGMAKLAGELGVKFHYGSEVEEITIGAGGSKPKASGIKVGGRDVEGDAVLCTADFPWAMKNLVKNKAAKGRYSDSKIDRMDYSCSCYLLYLGLDRKLEDLDVHNVSFAEDFEANINDIFSARLPMDPSLYFYCPSKLDPSLAPEGCEALYVLAPVPNLKGARSLYQGQGLGAFRAALMEKIRRFIGIPDLESHLRFMHEIGPLDFERDFNAYNGATFGLAPTLMQSNYFRPHNSSPGCEGLYFAGSSTHPGAGVPIVLTSAKLAVGDILSDLG